MQCFIIFGKTILIILSPHSINSDIHFAQGLLSLGCQKNIKAGSTRDTYLWMTLRVPWPRGPHFFFCPIACEILVPWPGIEAVPPAAEARSGNHWTTREVPPLHSIPLHGEAGLRAQGPPIWGLETLLLDQARSKDLGQRWKMKPCLQEPKWPYYGVVRPVTLNS